MDALPKLIDIHTIISSRMILIKEVFPIKIILDIYEHFYVKFDYPTYEVSYFRKINTIKNNRIL